MRFRRRIIERITEDIFGPRKPDERLPGFSQPRSQYLTGILYPQGTAPDEDEAENNVEEGGGEDGQSSLDDNIRANFSFLPSSIGVSFTVAHDENAKFLLEANIRTG
ncbi:MAG TPA: hypothetical protein DCG23_01180, partial [Deltaproteobacteria bacterium]|nr:hypothetical protein [Deltaproteobacteria bacterium]